MMVVCTHARPPLRGFGATFFGLPRTGVDLFFVISGLVVTRSLLRLLPDLTGVDGLDTAFDRSRAALKVFYTRRFFRIVPLALLALAFYRGLIALGVQDSKGTVDGYWHEVFAIFTGVYNYTHPYGGYFQLFPFWSLSVEEHFYLLLPLGFLLARTRARRAGLALCGIALVAVVGRNLFDGKPAADLNYDSYRLFSSHLRFDALLAGVAIAMLFDGAPSRPLMPPRFVKWVVVPACLALVWAVPSHLPANVYFHEGLTATWFFCAILVTYASFDRGYIFDVPVLGRALEYLGARSYGIYLLHIPASRINEALERYHPAYAQFRVAHPWCHWSLFVLAVVAVSDVSFRALEMPMQELGRRLADPSLPPWQLSTRWRVGLGAALATAILLWYRHPIERQLGPTNLALGAKVTASPGDAGRPHPELLTNGVLESEDAFETRGDPHPWIMIDLGKVVPISTIVTYNRGEGYQNEVLPLSLALSCDGEHFRRIATRRRIFSQWFPWRQNVGAQAARYVRYEGAENGVISLAEAEVYGPLVDEPAKERPAGPVTADELAMECAGEGP